MFGIVTAGMDVVDAIASVETNTQDEPSATSIIIDDLIRGLIGHDLPHLAVSWSHAWGQIHGVLVPTSSNL